MVAETRFLLETAANFIKVVAMTKGIELPMVAMNVFLHFHDNNIPRINKDHEGRDIMYLTPP